MHDQPDVRGLETTAYQQHGYFTTSQARERGISSQLLSHYVRRNRFERVRRGLYRLHGFPRPEDDEMREKWMAVGVEHKGESHGLLIDEIGEVLKLPAASREDNPVNLDARLARVSAGVHRLDGRLLVILDVERVLDAGVLAAAASSAGRAGCAM